MLPNLCITGNSNVSDIYEASVDTDAPNQSLTLCVNGS